MGNFAGDFRRAFTYVENALSIFSDHDGQEANRVRDSLSSTLSTLEEVAHRVVQVSMDINDVAELIGGDRQDPTRTQDQVFANQSGVATGGVTENPRTDSPVSQSSQEAIVAALQGLSDGLQHVSERLDAIEARRTYGDGPATPEEAAIDADHEEDTPDGVSWHADGTLKSPVASDPAFGDISDHTPGPSTPTPEPVVPTVPDQVIPAPDGIPQDPPPGVVSAPAPDIGTVGSPGDSTPGAGV